MAGRVHPPAQNNNSVNEEAMLYFITEQTIHTETIVTGVSERSLVVIMGIPQR
jgi:hypothetical protein